MYSTGDLGNSMRSKGQGFLIYSAFCKRSNRSLHIWWCFSFDASILFV